MPNVVRGDCFPFRAFIVISLLNRLPFQQHLLEVMLLKAMWQTLGIKSPSGNSQ